MPRFVIDPKTILSQAIESNKDIEISAKKILLSLQIHGDKYTNAYYQCKQLTWKLKAIIISYEWKNNQHDYKRAAFCGYNESENQITKVYIDFEDDIISLFAEGDEEINPRWSINEGLFDSKKVKGLIVERNTLIQEEDDYKTTLGYKLSLVIPCDEIRSLLVDIFKKQ